MMVAFVATALAADRVAVAVPASRPPIAEAARRFAGRLVVSFRRTIPAARLREYRSGEATPAPLIAFGPIETDDAIPAFAFSPFEFRLPPPSL